MQGTCGSPGEPSRVVAVPSQGQTLFGFGKVFVNLFVYLLSSGFRYIGIGGFHYFDSHQGDFAKGTYQVEVAISAEEEGFTTVADGFGVVLMVAVGDVVQNLITLVDDFVVLTPVSG